MSNDLFKLLFYGAIISILLLYALFKTRIKGYLGEKTVAAYLALLDKSKYKVINDLRLNYKGRTTQIDHLIISDFGIFVIETKNYKGWIFGSEHAEYWTQVIYKRKEKLYNPIRQNQGHISFLKWYLGESPEIRYISIIVFTSRASLKVNTNTTVTYPFNLLREIKRYKIENNPTINKEILFDKIKSLMENNAIDSNQHIKEIRQKIIMRENMLTQKLCPHCGGSLINRKGRFGSFWGCSNYPKCKFTVNS